MKVIHIPYCFHPDRIGGTEVYVEALAREQARQGIEAMIAAAAPAEGAYEHEGLPVRRFFEGHFGSAAELYGDGNPEAAQSFTRIVDAEDPDLVHLHAFSRAASLRLVRDCRLRGIPVVFSFHTPTVTCLRGTLLRWGTEVCDGGLDVRRCAQCKLHGLGLDRFSSTVIGGLPTSLSRWMGEYAGSGRIATALQMADLVGRYHDVVQALFSEADQVVAYCRWTKELLLRNGLLESKLTVSPQGLVRPAPASSERAVRPTGAPLRLAWLGRIDPVKGVHVLVEAVRRVGPGKIHLDLFGTQADERYAGALRQSAGKARVAFLPPVPPQEVVGLLQGYDAVAVPSTGLETGPLVVLEAFAAGVPVIGSKLGGIAELVTHGVDGLLVEPGDVAAWERTLAAVTADPAVLEGLRSGIRPPRSIRDCAEDILAVYGRCQTRSRCRG